MVRTRGASAAAVLSMVVLAATTGFALPDGTQDDAGYGTDAPDTRLSGLPLGPGSYQGNLTWTTDRVDAFRLDPPPKTVVRLQIETALIGADFSSPPVRANLRGPIGIAENGIDRRVRNLSITSGQGRPVNLTFETHTDFEPPPNRYAYNFTLTFERHDHVTALDAGDRTAAAWAVHLPEGQWGRVEVFSDPTYDPVETDATRYFSKTSIESPDGCWAGDTLGIPTWFPGGATGRTGADGDSVVWTHGLPQDVGVGSPVDAYTSPFRAPRRGQRIADAPTGNVTFGHAAARHDGPMGVRGWVVWDGPTTPVIEDRRADARLWTLEDFDEGGQALQVGPAAWADDVAASTTIADDPGATAVVVADALTPRIGPHPGGVHHTVMNVTFPNGSTVRIEDDAETWMSPAGGFEWPDGPAPPGPWRFAIDHLDGMEGDRIRAGIFEFDIPRCDVPP